MTENEVKRKLKELLSESYNYDVDAHGSQNLADFFDSMNFISLIIDIEDIFSLEIPDESLDINFLTSFDYLVDRITEFKKLTQ